MIRIVVADDHPIVRSGIVALLQDAPDVEVVGEASSGAEAVETTLRLKPDLVLMDLRMPLPSIPGSIPGSGGELDGVAATAKILAEEPDIRVIVLTTYESDETILSAIEAGATGYLLKAAPQEEILAGIRSVGRGEVALAPSIAAMLVRRVAKPVTATLSVRETQVLALVASGNSNPSIARALFLSEATVKTHLLHVFEKLGVSDRTRAVTLAMELGLLKH
jgi:DNA-binding NarL/FixJ family response regulator